VIKIASSGLVGRRRFLGLVLRGAGLGAAGATGLAAAPAALAGASNGTTRTGSTTAESARSGDERSFAHPDPRPGVDGTNVLETADVQPHVAELFDGIRAIPHVADGIGCHCGCGAMPDMRSLLSCYEGVGMAQFCVICEGEGRIAVRMAAEGATLDEIRQAVDRRYG
jgi:hypothetical protein